jgi:hypothetical protein
LSSFNFLISKFFDFDQFIEASKSLKVLGRNPGWQITEGHRNPELHDIRKILQSYGS